MNNTALNSDALNTGRAKPSSPWVAMIAIGGFATMMVGVAMVMGYTQIPDLPMTIMTSAGFMGLSFALAVTAVTGLSRISVWDVTAQVLPVWFSLTLLFGIFLIGFRLEYSVIFMAVVWPMGLIMLMVMGRVLSRRPNLVIGIPHGVDRDLISIDHVVMLDADGEAPQKLDLVIATSESLKDARYASMLSQFAARRIPVLPLERYLEQQTGRIDHHKVDPGELMQLRTYRRYMVLKRISDILMAAGGLILLAPVMVIVAVMIRLESPGPAIFVQRRVGEGGAEFRMYKFRSMVKDAEKSGAQFATASDARVTRLGRIIRKLRIDELPQLINVLMGSMSMIGPRPEQKAFVDDLEKEIPLYPIRHAVRPGITGWAQVMQGYADDVSSTDVKLSYDLFYIKNLSLMMDMVIFFKTIKTIFTGFGAR